MSTAQKATRSAPDDDDVEDRWCKSAVISCFDKGKGRTQTRGQTPASTILCLPPAEAVRAAMAMIVNVTFVRRTTWNQCYH
ncbi:uncharacterized protein SPSK_02098 [Sporothrix schenckii 1099-18]|uniref:Uncharacterized protein n=1 Tax=Sporothrix schenckii 1099-18 TaxID=1397361 RepID=A0A0F2MB58_SPOSC|nr:uncharacterized protein SPSK_02098 [Sporothrix schenckii 1099-18]KJR86877.1 hypothetical protein SPSK_02098 [Sporothrix schenckii 1099-18]